MDQIGSLRYQPQIPSRRAISPSPFPAFSISVLPRYPAPAPCGNNRSGNPAEQKRWRERGTERAPQKTETSLAPGIGCVSCYIRVAYGRGRKVCCPLSTQLHMQFDGNQNARALS
ncbi:hypothetical protein BRADI_3g20317v3 [Brachypodium distachyon]|uniref:Uncharacterized protein n=1 Tax=Brachypodium distachyon TaxID=15368 RepID=I1I2R5_BRADI|nr:hypothetical protein BRADI_3g20317v3 [Brachypodium distachyon]